MEIVHLEERLNNLIFGNSVMKSKLPYLLKPFYFALIMGITTFYSCQKPVDLKATTTNINILVVEGFINVADSTKISLSRTTVIGNKTTANPELNAQLTLENATGTVATLQHLGKGLYATQSLILDNTKQYRIRIKTSNGKTYLSDLTDTKITQPIDDVGYNITNDGISIYASTHDATNNSRYYLYNFEETWEFRTKFISEFKTTATAVVPRTPEEFIEHCYAYAPSTKIIVNSTAALSQDVAYQAPITNVPSNSEKLSIKYSILVTQTALTKEAYAFWDNLSKNSEKLGSIFDVQPSQVSGNIHNVADAAEPVIGYISAGTKQSKRFFIKSSDLPSNYRPEDLYLGCVLDTTYYVQPVSPPYPLLERVKLPYLPVEEIVPNPLFPQIIIGFSYTPRTCADCTLRGRVPKPSFWQ